VNRISAKWKVILSALIFVVLVFGFAAIAGEPITFEINNTSLSENAASGSFIGEFQLTSEISNPVYTLSSGQGDNVAFSITGASLYSAATFDFEEKNSYYVVVDAAGDEDSSGRETFTINITDIMPVADDIGITIDEDSEASGILPLSGDTTNVVFSALQGPTKGDVDINTATGAYTYTPNADENGEDHFSYSVTDGTFTDTGTVTVTITAMNDAPVIRQGETASIECEEDGDAVELSLSASDAEDDTLAWYVILQAEYGIAEVGLESGIVSYMPTNADYYGKDSFTVMASDENGGTDSILITVTISPVNDPPSFTVAGSITVNEDCGTQTNTDVITAMSAGPENESGQSLVFEITGNTLPSLFETAPAVDENGTLTFTPAGNAFGSAAITLSLRDSEGAEAAQAQEFTIIVNAMNDTPVCTSLPIITGIPHNGQILRVTDGSWNDDKDGIYAASLQYTYHWQSAVTPQSEWSNILLADTNEYELTSAQNNQYIRVMVTCTETGADPQDAVAYSDPVLITNSAPVIDQGESITLDVTEDGGQGSIQLSAVNEDGDTLSWSIAPQGTKGEAAIVTDNGTTCDIAYSPSADQNGEDSFIVTVSDGNGGTDSITVNVTIDPQNDPPSFAIGADQDVSEDCGGKSIEDWITEMSAGPDNESGQTLTFTVESNGNPSLFTDEPVISADGTLYYTPKPDAFGYADIAVSLYDSEGAYSDGYQTFRITVNPVNDTPVNTTLPTISGVLHNGKILSVSKGVWNDDKDGMLATTLSYTYQWQSASSEAGPWNDIAGAQSEAFTLTSAQNDLYIRVMETCTDSDETPLSAAVYSAGMLVMNITPAIDQGESIALDVTEDGGQGSLQLSAVDEDGDTLSWSIAPQGTKGEAVIATDNGTTCDIAYSPSADQNGEDSFVVTVSDGNGGTDSITVNVTIDPQNDPPSFTIGADQDVSEDCGGKSIEDWITEMSAGPDNESDQELYFTIESNSNEPLFSVAPSVDSDGILRYTPKPNAHGSATVFLYISDSEGGSSEAQSFTITVNAVNDTPGNTELPSISGTLAVGGALTASAGTWDDSADDNTLAPEDFTCVWQTAEDTQGAGLAQAGTGWSYEVLAADAHLFVRVLVEVTDTDDAGTVTAQAYSAWYELENTAPEIQNAEPEITTAEDTNGTVSLSALDADEDTLVWGVAVQAHHGAAVANEETGLVTYTPNADYFGYDSFTVSVSDGHEGADSVVVSVTVSSQNDIPTFTIGENQLVDEDGGIQIVDPFIQTMSAGPANESGQTLIFHVTENSNPDLFSAEPVVSSSGILTYTAAADAFGSADITVSVSDSDGATNEATQSFTITVNSVNDAPRCITSPVISGIAHNGQTLVISAGSWSDSADGANATALVYSYQWQTASSESGPWSNIAGATQSQYTLTLDENDLFIRVVFTCSDSDIEPASANEVSQALLVANAAPVISQGETAEMTFEEDDGAKTLTLDATDADDDTLTWGITEASRGEASVDEGVVTYQPYANDNGNDSFTVTVSDVNGGSDSIAVSVTINAVNDMPTFTVGYDETVEEDSEDHTVYNWIRAMSAGPSNESAQTLSFAVSDITDETLFSALPVVSDDGTLSYTLAANQYGSAQVSVSVSDSEGGENPAKQSFTITVNAVNDTPELVTDPAITGTFRAGYTVTASSGVWNDELDDNAGTIVYDYTWFFADDDQGTNAVSQTGTNEYPLTSAQSHKYVRVRVGVTNTDASGTTQTQAYTSWYAIENTAPVITETAASVTTDEDTAYFFTLHATDADDDTLNWGISSGAGHGSAEVNISTGYITYTPALNYRGEDTFTVRVADAFEGSNEVIIPVTVNAVNDVPINTVLPSVSGTHQYGNTLTASEGTWTDDADDNLVTLTYGYQWQRASDDQGSDIADIATGTSYVLTAAESHQYVRVLITVTDTDASGTVQTQAASAWTYVENTNPVITETGPSITTDEDTVQTLILHATDVDTDTLTWAVTAQGTRGTASIGETTGLITYTPKTDDNGSDSFEITVSDGHGGTNNVFVLVTINAVNDVPSFTVGDHQTVAEDCGVQSVPQWITVMSEGPDNESEQTLTYTVTITDETVTDSESLFAADPAVGPEGTLTYTPATNAYGSATLSITVQDNGGGESDTSEAQTFTITVTPVNDNPVITGIAAVETPEDEPYVYEFTLKDVEDGPDTLDIAYTTDNTALLEKGSMVLGGSGANRTLTLSPEENRSGTVHVSFSVTDSQGGKATKTVTLTVNAVNDAPTISAIANPTTYEDTSTGAIGLTIADVDTAISSCTVSAVSLNTDLVPNDEAHITVSGTTANRTITILPAQDQYGTADITLTVSDGSLTADTTFTLTVDAVNDKPTISGIADRTINEDTNTGAITFTVDDIDNTMTELDISAAANNTSMVPKNNIVLSDIDEDGKATVTVTPVANYNGTSTITLTVKDPSGAFSTESFLLTVNPVNDPPTMTAILSQSTNEDTTRTFNVYIQDIDTSAANLELTYVKSTNTALLPEDDEHIIISESSNTRSVSLVPFADQNGTTYVTLQVSDGGTQVATRQFLFKVNEVNDTPYFTPGADITVPEDCGAKTYSAWATGISAGADNENETLSFNVQADMEAMFAVQPAIDASGNLSFTPAGNANGIATITISLTDEGGMTSESVTFKITITSLNDVPVAYDMATGLDTDEDQQLKGSLQIYDPDQDTMTFELVSGDEHNVTTLTTATGGIVTLDAAAGTFTYKPYENYYEGSDSFSYRVRDDKLAYSNDAQVIIHLTGVNDPPVASDGTLTVDEDAKDIEGSLDDRVADIDNVTLEYAIVSEPNQGGTVTLDSESGDYTYTAPKDYFGTERFTFRAFDGATYSNTATITVTINAVNDAPVAQDETINLDEGKTLSGKFKATDIELDAITYSIVTPPASGTLTLVDASTGAYTYTPPTMTTEATVTVTAVFKAEDPSGDFTNGTITVVVRNINDAPYIADETQLTVTTDEDTAMDGSIAAVDPDGDTLVYTILNTVNHGTLSGFDSATGNYTYTPYGNYHGTDYFTFIAKESGGEGALSTGIYRVSITVTSVNDNPTAYTLYYYTNAATAITLSPVGYDPDGDSMTYSIESELAYGTITTTDDVTFTYTPNGTDTGVTDVIVYKALDGQGGESSTATMYVHIYGEGPGGGLSGFDNKSIPENSATDSIPITVSGIEIGQVSITSSNTWLLSNDYANDIIITNDNGNYSFVLTPNAYRTGRTVITVRVTDTDENVHTRTFVLTVTPVYYQPTANDMERTIDENTEMYEYVSGSDLNGYGLRFTVTSQPSHGTLLAFSSNGTFHYEPEPGYSGDDSFTFTAANTKITSETATVTIHITSVPCAPSADNAEFSTPEDTEITNGQLIGSSPGNTGVTFHLVSNGTLGTAVVNENGSFTYTPNENANGIDVFTFKTEGCTTLYSSIATVTVTIGAVNDQPVADAKTVSTFEDQALQGYLTASDVDEDDTLTYGIEEREGTLLLGEIVLDSQTGQFTYTPDENANGTDTFYFTASDGTADSQPALMTVEIEAQNDAPTVEDSAITVGEDSSVNGELTWLYEDIDGDAQTFSTLQEPGKGTIEFNTDGTFTYTPFANENGIDYFSYRTKDTAGLSSNVALVTVTITPENDAPTIDTAAAWTINEDSKDQVFYFTVDDVEDSPDVLTLSAEWDAEAMGTPEFGGSGNNRWMKVTPVDSYQSDTTITITVTDTGVDNTLTGDVKTAEAVVAVTVSPVNDTPTIDGYSVNWVKIISKNVEIDEDTSTNPISFKVNDEETHAAGVTVTASASNTTLVPSSGITLTGAGEDRTITVTPAANQYGSCSIRIYASDGETTRVAYFTLVVKPINDAPVITPPADQTIYEDGNTGDLYYSISDIDSTITNITVTAASGDEEVVIPADITLTGNAKDRVVNITPLANQNGDVTITLTADDHGTEDNAGSASFVVHVLAVNDTPTIEAISDVTIPEDGVTAAIPVNVEDIDDELSALTLSAVSGNPSLADAGCIAFSKDEETGQNYITLTPKADANGAALITVKVMDEGGKYRTTSFTLNVTPVNDAPTITAIADQTILEDGKTAAITFKIADIDNDVLNLTVAGNSDDANVIPTSGFAFTGNGGERTVTITPLADKNGVIPVSLTVRDPGGLTDTSPFTVSVTPVNDEPSFTGGDDQTVLEDCQTQTVSSWATHISKGPDNESYQELTFHLENDNEDLFTSEGQPALDAKGQLTYTPADDLYGAATVTVYLTDNGGTANGGDDTSDNDPSADSIVDTFTITVLSVNDRPVFSALGETEDITVNEDSGAYENAWADTQTMYIGPEGNETQTYNFILTLGSVNVLGNTQLFSEAPSIDSLTGVISFTPALNANGTADVTVVLKDDDGTANGGMDTSVEHTFTITVVSDNDDPTFTLGSDITVNEDSGLYSDGLATGITAGGGTDEETQDLTFTLDADNKSIFSVQPAMTSGGVLTFATKADQHGSATVSVVLDDETNEVSDSFTITVNSVNDAPTFTYGDALVVWEDCGKQTVSGWGTNLYTGADNESSQTLSFDVTALNDNLFIATGQPALDASGILTFTPAANANGESGITLYLIDDGGTLHEGVDRTYYEVNSITVLPVNDQPSFTDLGDISVGEDSGVYNEAWVQDGSISVGPANEATQTYSFYMVEDETERKTYGNTSLFSTEPAIDPDTGDISFTPAENANGSATYTVYLQDNGGTEREGVDTSQGHELTITVEAINDNPTYTLGGTVTVNEDSGTYENSFATGITTGGGTDETGQSLTFTLSAADRSLFSAQPAMTNTGVLTFTPAEDKNGSTSVSVELTDGGNTVIKSFTITILPVNDQPSFTDTGNIDVEEDCGAKTIAWVSGYLLGPANEIQTPTFSMTEDSRTTYGNAELFSSGPVINALTGTVSFTPAANANGSVTFTVTLCDNGGTDREGIELSQTHSLTISIDDVNDDPTYSISAAVGVNEDGGEYRNASFATGISRGGGTDEADQSLTFTLSGYNTDLFDGDITLSNTGELLFSTAANAHGSTTVNVSLSDGTNDVEDSFTITIASVNDEPSFTRGENQMVWEDCGAQTETGWATNLNKGTDNESGQTLTFHVENDNTALFAGGGQPAIDSGGTLRYTPAADQFGEAKVSVYVTDDGGTANGGDDTSATITFTITVESVNDQPVFTDYGNITVEEDSGAYSEFWVDAESIDPGPSNETQNYTFSMVETAGERETNGNTTLFSEEPAIDAVTGRITFTPASNAFGSATYTVYMKDEDGTLRDGVDTSQGHSLVITVTSVNDLPEFTLPGDVTADEDSGAYQDAIFATGITPGGGTDEEDQPLTFTLSDYDQTLFSVQPVLTNTGELTFKPKDNANGTTQVTVTLSDEIDQVERTFTIIIRPVNDAPTFTASGNVSVSEDCGTQTVPGWASDISIGPDNESTQELSVETLCDDTELFDGESGMPNVSLTGVLGFTPKADVNGTATVTVQYKDNGGRGCDGDDDSDIVEFTITILPVNDRPSFADSGNITVLEDSAAYAEAWVKTNTIYIGPDNENQTYEFSMTEDESQREISGNTQLFSVQPAIDPISGAISFTPAGNASGSAVFTVVVKDTDGTDNGGQDTSLEHELKIFVSSVDDPPTFALEGNVTVNEDSGQYQKIAFATGITAGGGSDETTQELTFTLENDNQPLFSRQPAMTSGGILTFTPAGDAFGTALVTVVLDDETNTVSDTFTITVESVNDQPVFTDYGNITVEEDSGAYSELWVDAESIDPGPSNETQNYTFSMVETAGERETNGNTTLFSEEPAIDAATGRITFTPASNAFGSATYTVYMKDEDGTLRDGVDTSQGHSLVITVTSVNDLPEFTLSGDVTADEDSGAYQDAIFATGITPGGGTDEEDQPLTFTLSDYDQTLFSVQPVLTNTGTLTFTPAEDAFGSTQVGVTLSDGDDSSNKTFTIAINPVNDQPSFTDAGDITVSEDSGSYSAAWADDTSHDLGPENEKQTYQYRITQTVVADGIALFSVEPAINALTGAISFTPAANEFGSAEVTVVLQDDDGTANNGIDTSQEHTFTITVLSVNDPPMFTDIGDLTVNEDNGAYSVQWVTLISAGPDNETQEAAFSIELDESTLEVYGNTELFTVAPAIDQSTGEIIFTPAENANGSIQATVLLTDTDGTDNEGKDTSTEHSFLITVNTVNDAPVFTAGEDVTVGCGTGSYTQEHWASDISAGPMDEALQKLSFDLAVDKPELFDVQPAISADGILSFTPGADVSGTAQITVMLKDDGGTANGGADTSEQQQFTIQVVGNSELELTGIVYSAKTLEPINGAYVRLMDSNGDEMTSAIVGADGVYRFGGLTGSSETLTLIATAEGHQESRIATEVSFAKDISGTITQDIQLSEFYLTVTVEPSAILGDGEAEAVITATVQNDEGQPIGGVEVQFDCAAGTFKNGIDMAVTGANGECNVTFISEKLPGITELEVPIKAIVYDDVRKLYGTAVIYERFVPGFVEGIVTTRSGNQPLQGAIVTVYKDYDGDGKIDFTQTVITGADGRYNVAIPRGNVEYNISITRPATGNGSSVTFEQSVQVGDINGGGGETSNPGRSAVGIVTMQNGSGSACSELLGSGMQMEIIGNGTQSSVNLNAAAGTFSAGNLAEGSYTLNVYYEHENGSKIIVGSQQITISNNGETNISEVLIDPYGVITDSETGDVISGAVVKLYYADTGVLVSLPSVSGFPPANNANPQTSDAAGEYAFMVYPNTAYYIVAVKDGYETFSNKDNPVYVGESIVNYNFQMTPVEEEIASSFDPAVFVSTEGNRVLENGCLSCTITYGNKTEEVLPNAVIRLRLPAGILVEDTGGGVLFSLVDWWYPTKVLRLSPEFIERDHEQKVVWLVKDLQPEEVYTKTVLLHMADINPEETESYMTITAEITTKESIAVPEDDTSFKTIVVASLQNAAEHCAYLQINADGSFQVDDGLTRGDAAAIFASILGLSGENNDIVFADVQADDPHLYAIRAITTAGYLRIDENAMFYPDRELSRAEFIAMVANYLGIEREFEIEPLLYHYTDIEDHLLRSTIEEAYRYGLLSPFGEQAFQPDTAITKSEAVIILNRMLCRGAVTNPSLVFTNIQGDDPLINELAAAAADYRAITNDDGSETLLAEDQRISER